MRVLAITLFILALAALGYMAMIFTAKHKDDRSFSWVFGLGFVAALLLGLACWDTAGNQKDEKINEGRKAEVHRYLETQGYEVELAPNAVRHTKDGYEARVRVPYKRRKPDPRDYCIYQVHVQFEGGSPVVTHQQQLPMRNQPRPEVCKLQQSAIRP